MLGCQRPAAVVSARRRPPPAGSKEVAIQQRLGLVGAPLAALALLVFVDLDPGNPLVTRMAAVAVWMAGWWITEAIPIPATALLPVALMPLLGILPGKEVAALYFNHIIFLFLGGFIFALAMQRWNLHRRIALELILVVGTGPRRLLLGFMLATWFLSMWISNTATTMMMVPMAVAIILELRTRIGGAAAAAPGGAVSGGGTAPEGVTVPDGADAVRIERYAIGLLLGIAYAASIGGIATLIGTPPNLSLSRIFAILFPDGPEIAFATWFAFALPLSALFLVIAWLVLCRLFAPGGDLLGGQRQVVLVEKRQLGRLGYEEAVVLALFALLVVAWMFRVDIAIGERVVPGWTRLLGRPGYIDDGTIAITLALCLFVIPARRAPTRIMDWETAVRLRWGIVLLFGGGFALAAGFAASGLSGWLGERLAGLGGAPAPLLVGAVCGLITFLTELTSNTATTEMVLPVLGALGGAITINPLLLMIPATLSASCAFMLPVATPPNAIVFGTGEVDMGSMMRAGILLNLIGIVLITLSMFLIGTAVFGIDPAQLPAWALPAAGAATP
ncbi:MAG: SLC13 family permease [Candidatus Eiseniibacteriota bacterium]